MYQTNLLRTRMGKLSSLLVPIKRRMRVIDESKKCLDRRSDDRERVEMISFTSKAAVKTNSPGYTRVYRAVYGAIGGSLGTIAADPESAGGRSRSLVFRALVVSSSSPDDWEKPYSEEHAMKKCDISEKEKRVDGKNERPYTTAMMEKFYTIHIKRPYFLLFVLAPAAPDFLPALLWLFTLSNFVDEPSACPP
jgi:hypothetical protein